MYSADGNLLLSDNSFAAQAIASLFTVSACTLMHAKNFKIID